MFLHTSDAKWYSICCNIMSVTAKKKLVAPDGGWGWAVAAAFGIYFFLVFSLLASFGLIYKTEFKRLGFSGAQSSLIISTNGGFSMLCGLINGSLINKFGTRKVSVCSACLIVLGLTLTAYSTTFIQFMIFYGIITSIGMGMGTSAYSIALNLYFVKRRNAVTGYVMALYGVGTIFFPQLVSYLLANFTVKDTMLILTALCANTLAAALLLQPVKWHMKPEVALNAESGEEDALFEEKTRRGSDINDMRIHDDVSAIHASMSSLNIKSPLNIPQNNYMMEQTIRPEKTTILRRIKNVLIKTFDLSLLKDLSFLNILIGLSIDFFVEFSYLCLLPFILMDNDLTVEQSATFLSVYSVADISFRVLTPFIAALFKLSNRIMYIIAIVLVVIPRSLLLFITDYLTLLFVAAAIGAFRGMRLVHWSLVIPEYVPTERLAVAFGLLFTLNGLCLFIGGPILGALRDISGNYKTTIILLNSITATTITMLASESVYKKINLRRSLQNRDISE